LTVLSNKFIATNKSEKYKSIWKGSSMISEDNKKPKDKLFKYDILLCSSLPIFLDVHKVPFSEENLKELCGSPTDEFGVRHVNLFYNKEANVCFCLLDAPNQDAVEKHHTKADIKCEWITEVTMAAENQQ